ncbi:odorant receptor 4-like [Calliopsis andreniformis]|uniref:odorant receptor 4-like n=1 Tax=Calliopsis andreniformis TaxID=337506 RepID=UPI003FCC342E
MATPKSTISRPIEICLRVMGLWPKSSYVILRRVLLFVVLGILVSFQLWYCVSYIKSADLPDLLDGISIFISNIVAFVKLIVIWCNYSALLVMANNINEGLDSNERQLILKMRLPFDVTVSPIYEIFLIVQFVFEYTMAVSAGMLIALFTALVLHVSGQINIMCRRLRECPMDNENEAYRELKSLVIKHQQIIHLSNNIKYLFTYTSLSLGTKDGSKIAIKCFPYYVAIISEAFVLCYTGEYLTSKSAQINEAAYNIAWYKLHLRENRIVLMLLIRAKKPMTLTAGKFVDLNLETYASMLKASASYVSILLAMY